MASYQTIKNSLARRCRPTRNSDSDSDVQQVCTYYVLPRVMFLVFRLSFEQQPMSSCRHRDRSCSYSLQKTESTSSYVGLRVHIRTYLVRQNNARFIHLR